MSRSGYCDDLDHWAMVRWRGAVEAAIRGERGQAFLREMLAALDAMPVKELIAKDLVGEDGVCAKGAVARFRGLDVSQVDPYDWDVVADLFGIAAALAREIAYENDEGGWQENNAQRWERMRRWVVANLREPEAAP